MLLKAHFTILSFAAVALLNLSACALLTNDKPQQGLLPNGSRYDVPLVEGVLSGQGTLTNPDGSHYQGQFSQGVFSGDGELTLSNGDSYKGQFANGLPNGAGIFHYSNGSVYSGEVKNNLMNGTGSFASANGETFTGTFIDGIFTGEGVFTNKDGTRYQGGFNRWQYQGKGQLTLKDGSRYDGEFKDNLFSGQGRFIDADGNSYIGEFAYGRYNGKGLFTYAKPYRGIKSFNGRWRYGDIIESDKPGIIFDSAALVETALYNQIELIDAQLVKIETERSKTVDVFFVGVAGDGRQDVFLREIKTVQNVMGEKLNASNRQIILANNRDTPATLPMATLKSLDYTLEAVGQMMGEEDILFLYLSSHGSKPTDNKKTEFLLGQTGMDLHDLSPAALKAILDKHHLPFQVVVVSSCYSGGFIPPLKADNRLVITSSAADKQSFGCSDEEDMTYFGEALFKHGLYKTLDIKKAFYAAKNRVSKREAENKFEPSEPQISKAPALIAQWQLLTADMDDKEQ
jgi:hypothetical protein